MSEPLSTTEIEDVLSSIRRLVAEDLRPQAQPKPSPSEAVRHKLILTPALRVVASDGDADPAPDMAVVVSNLGSGLSQSEWEPEAEEAADRDQALTGEAAQDMADHGWAFDQDEAAPVDETTVFMPADAPEMTEEAVDETVDEAAGDTDSGDAVSFAEPTFVSVRRSAVVDDVPSWAQSVEAEDEAESDAPAPVAGTIEPDPEWADAAEADVLAELHEATKDEEAQAFAMASVEAAPIPDFDDTAEPDGQEPIYDEALLREIVRDLLREELQGAMGERITRNIRKLVRAEIARALATQDLT